MDAASNNSVDDIRDLRERVAYAPVSGRAKVYILDEAHMLTAAAWNAFLKTLEEPPPNTVFVLATTEANKILPTVADRCHRFDFTRPTVEQIATVLRRVADQESIEIPADALALVARHATGSFRDALGTLEQLVTYSGASIALEDVLAVLGVADADLLFETLEAVAAHDPRRALLVRGQARRERPRRERVHPRPRGPRPRPAGRRHARRGAGGGRDDARPRRAAGRAGPARAARRRRPAARAARPRAGGHQERRRGPHAARARARQGRPAARRRVDAGAAVAARAARGAARRHRTGARACRRRPRLPHRPPPRRAPTACTAGAAREEKNGRALHAVPDEPPRARPPPRRPRRRPPRSSRPRPRSSTPSTTCRPPAATLDLGAIRGVWPAVVDQVKAENLMLGAAIAKSRPCELRGDDLVIAFGAEDSFYRRKAEDQACRQLVADAVRALTGKQFKLSYDTRDDAVEPEAEPTLSEDEIVARFKAEFEAEEIVPHDDPPGGAPA